MTDTDIPGPQLVAEAAPADRFAQLPEGVDAQQAEDNIKRAFAKLGARRNQRRQAEAERFQAAEVAEVKRLNRANALRTIVQDGVTLHFGACACRWHGIRVSDPEVALREYDAHPCTIPLEDDHPAFRELRIVDGRVVKRPASTLAVNQVLPDGRVLNSLTEVAGAEMTPEQAKATTGDDDGALRMALLELK